MIYSKLSGIPFLNSFFYVLREFLERFFMLPGEIMSRVYKQKLFYIIKNAREAPKTRKA